jgi:hypothetical protein
VKMSLRRLEWQGYHFSNLNLNLACIDIAGSSGLFDSQCDAFDRISFTWNGRQGAKVLFKFNCLSTDFSRIKGVKGIPLRIAAETNPIDNEHQIERSFCKIKLFRDKVSYGGGLPMESMS